MIKICFLEKRLQRYYFYHDTQNFAATFLMRKTLSGFYMISGQSTKTCAPLVNFDSRGAPGLCSPWGAIIYYRL